MAPLNEVEELQREERKITTQLDDLVEKFTVKFLEEQVSLDEFTLGYWTQRMEIKVGIPSVDTETSYRNN